MHPPPLQAIIFDLGGVIIDIDPERSLRTFEQMGHTDIRPLYETMAAEGWFARLEMGEVSPALIFDRLRHGLSRPVDDRDILRGWNALLGTIPATRIQLLERLSLHFRLYLLSNTNVIHMESIHRYVDINFGAKNMGHWFDQDYYSYEMGLRKPDPAIFEVVVEEQALDPTTTLFVDDTYNNILTARQLGFQTLHVSPGDDVVALMHAY